MSMVLGIGLGHLWWEVLSPIHLLGGAGLLLLASLLLGKHDGWRSLLLLLAFMALGAGLDVVAEQEAVCPLPQGKVRCKGVLASEPVEGDKYYRADVILLNGEFQGRKARVYLHKVGKAEKPVVGAGVEMNAVLRKSQSFAESNFNYPLYLKSHGIVAIGTVYGGGWRATETCWQGLSALQRMRLKAMCLRHRLVARYAELGLAGDCLAVVSAMTLGDKSSIGKDLRQTYAATGTSHILALSGMHLGIIYTLLLFLTIGRGRGLVRTLLLLASVWAFVLLVGLSPSVVRAAVMLSIYSIVTLSTRDAASFNTLALTAVLMLVASPLSLFDLGFQLSFVSVGAIVLFAVPIGRILSSDFQQRHPFLRYAWQLAVMSTVAQMATAPLSVYYFGQTSLYFLLANFVVIPMATVILYAAVAVFVLTPFPVLCHFAAKMLAVATETLNTVLAGIASLPGATLEGLKISFLQFVLLQFLALVLLWMASIGARIFREWLEWNRI